MYMNSMKQDEFGIVTRPGVVRFERLLPAGVDRAWAFLTSPGERARWFAGGSMPLVSGGVATLEFDHTRLSGERTPERFAELADGYRMTSRVTCCEPERRLCLAWEEDGPYPSEVSFELAPQGGDTRLVLTHRRLRDREALISAASGWHAHLSILEDRLIDRAPRPFWSLHERCEMEYQERIARTTGPRVRVTRRFDATVERVFDAWHQSQETDHVGEYLEIDRPRQLVFTWDAAQPQGEASASRVGIDILAMPGGCELTLVHELDPAWTAQASRMQAGWTSMLEKLAERMEPAAG